MGAQENIKLVQDMNAADRARDEERYLSFWADDATTRFTGVPRALGGLTQGKAQIRENFRNAQPPFPEPQVRTIFADDKHVCVVARVTGKYNGTAFFKGTGQPYTIYSCIVYEIEGGRIKSSTNYMNLLDMYVQVGLVDVSKLTA